MPPAQQLEEREGEQLLDRLAVDLARPRPIEVGHRLESPDRREPEASFQAPTPALLLLGPEQPLDKGRVGDLIKVGA